MHGLDGIKRLNDEHSEWQKRTNRLRAAGRLPQPRTVRHKPVCVGCEPGNRVTRLAAYNPKHALGLN